MPAATPQQIDAMEVLLKSGPLVIGEDHELAYARSAIQELIARKAVSFLSIETPIGPLGLVRSDGQLRKEKVSAYFGAISGHHNTITTRDLVDSAIAQTIPVYCHDVPLKTSPLNRLADPEKPGDLDVYRNQAKAHLPNSMRNLPMRDSTAAKQFVQRNEYSANYLKTKLGAGVRVLFNLIVLAGADHLDGEKCGGNERTLQARLGVANERAFTFC